MDKSRRKVLAAIGVTASALVVLAAAPAQAATTGVAKVTGSGTVVFTAASGRQNSVVITIKGRTVTLDDRVALKAGKGCKRVDKTRVTCTTAKKTTKIQATLGDRKDKVTDKTSVPLYADGGSGDDTLIGGSGRDQLKGGTGADTIKGRDGRDSLAGGAGNDVLDGGSGGDQIIGDDGDDVIHGRGGADDLYGRAGKDVLYGDDGDDTAYGGDGDDTVSGGAGADVIVGEWLVEDNGYVWGDPAAVDRLDGGTGSDRCGIFGTSTATNCEAFIPIYPWDN
ncbi:calcium-binding protein [Actinoplanes sp. NPDC051851]|uniref:calcium-binding protein n=1 Tax=Actinoplanes sp. NPDC051851 TaxID=3154753 RepID=UPI003438DA1F